MFQHINTKFLTIALSYFFITVANAQVLQNMVKNPSFEQYTGEVPNDLGQIDRCAYWSSATKAGADYYHERAKGDMVKAPYNKMGKAKPLSGRAYGGIYAYTSRYTKRNYREYLQVRLKHPMAPGEEYCVKMQVYLSESSNRAISALGIGATKMQVMKDHEENIADLPFVYLLHADKKPLDSRKWVQVEGTYKAQGGENFLIIGNFDDDKKTKATGAIEIDSFRNPHVDFAYYYIDNVCVTSLRTNFTCECGPFDLENLHREKIIIDVTLKRKTYRLGEVDVLNKVQFEKDKANFLEGAQKDLDQLLVILKMNPNYEMEIQGHTNDRGDPRENQFLSKRRAKAVYDYLVAGGIVPERLSYRGYGQSRPMMLNDSEEGRTKNERIQIKVLKI
jgi:OOP family OmpA-OmpF porin